MATEVVLASRNDGKLAEMQALFAPLGWKLRSIAEFCDDAAEEPAPSFVENALLKARHAALVSGLPAIADDSGLEVAQLEGAPGVRSARYAGDDASDVDNNRKLLAALKNVPDERRGARFVCLMVYLRHAEDATPVIAMGSWRGTILHNPRGANGFGYDPLFVPQGYARTFGQLGPKTKANLSHRALALKKFITWCKANPVEE